MCLASEYMKWWCYVNTNGCTIKGVAITHICICKECRPIIFHKIANWNANNIPIRLHKSLVGKYTKVFSDKGWYIDPRYWSYLDPLRFCWYATVEPSGPSSFEVMGYKHGM